MKSKFGELNRKVIHSYIKHYGLLLDFSTCHSLYKLYQSKFGLDLNI